jgi:proliferating cell nuclear antigen PCNA
MKFIIQNKEEKQLFVAMFELLKSTSSMLNLHFKEDELYIQGMDRSHVCLFDINIKKDWFASYSIEKEDAKKICIHTQTIHTILSSGNDSHAFEIYYHGQPDHLNIDLIVDEENKNKDVSKREFSRYYKIPLVDDDYTYLEVPTAEYDVEFSFSAKKINEIVNKMAMFGENLRFDCNEERIDLFSDGVSGEMKVTIPLEDINECSITEGIVINSTFHLGYLQKTCLSTKLAEDIEFSISPNQPMRLVYRLGKESHVVFYIAPKMD